MELNETQTASVKKVERCGDLDSNGNGVVPDKYQSNMDLDPTPNGHSTTFATDVEMADGGDNQVHGGHDQDDGLMKLLKCGLGKSKLLDEDEETYGFNPEIDKVPNQSVSKNKNGIQRKKTQNDENNFSEETCQRSSYKKAIDTSVQTHNTSTIVNEDTRVYVSQSGNKTTSVSDENRVGSATTQNNSASHQQYEKKFNSRIGRTPQSSAHMDEDRYNFSHPERGYMVLIVNDMFYRQARRDGAQWDLMKSKEIARKLGFRLHNYGNDKNLTQAQTLRVLREIQGRDHSNCDCFVFVFSSHGLEQANPRAKGKPDHALVCADDRLIFTSDIIEMFNDQNCPTLKNKPKLFFIQACRGESLDEGGNVFVAFPRRSEDKTCGVNAELFSSPVLVRSKKESVDESDTNPGDDSWATNPSTRRHPYGEVFAMGGIPTAESTPYRAQHGGEQSTWLTSKEDPWERQTNSQLRTSHPTPQYCVPKVSAPSTQQQGQGRVTHAPSHLVHKIYAPRPFPVVDTPSLKCSNDMLVMYAIPPGMFAWRNTSDGSWMIDYLHQVIMAYDMKRPKSLLSVLTKVAGLMAFRTTNAPSAPEMDGKKAVPMLEHKLTKDVFFQQKVPSSDWVRKGFNIAI